MRGGLRRGTKGNGILQAHLQGTPQPKQQRTGAAQFPAAALEQQSQQPRLRGGIEQSFDHLQVVADLLQPAEQQRLGQPERRRLRR